MKSLYKEYVEAVCNGLSINGLALETKEEEALVEKSHTHFQGFLEHKKGNAELFFQLLVLPLSRIDEYVRFLLDVRNDTESYYSPFSLDKIKIAHSHWKQLAVEAHEERVSGLIICLS